MGMGYLISWIQMMIMMGCPIEQMYSLMTQQRVKTLTLMVLAITQMMMTIMMDTLIVLKYKQEPDPLDKDDFPDRS
jgi:biotin transporter BioY